MTLAATPTNLPRRPVLTIAGKNLKQKSARPEGGYFKFLGVRFRTGGVP